METKEGLEYYPFDVDFFNDLKVKKLIRCQGGKSITVYNIILCAIYHNGYYVEMTETLRSSIVEISGYAADYVNEVIAYCANVGLFNRKLYDKNILTSQGVQKRFVLINKLRGRSIAIDKYNCIVGDINTLTIDNSRVEEQQVSALDKEITELKNSEVWLDNLQLLHHIHTEEIKKKLDEFKLQCAADGLPKHDTIADAKKHFNAWLRIKNNYDKNRTNGNDKRRGNILAPNEQKAYTNTF